MKYTQSEILRIQNVIVLQNLPISIDSNDPSKYILRCKHDKNIFATLRKILQYEFTAKNSDGQFMTVAEQDFEQFLYRLKNWIVKVKHDNPLVVNRNEQIEKFSPKFYTVFEEAKIINYLNYKESAGMIYRKSLEVLIKDFWLINLPIYSEIVLEETVGGIVNFFYYIENGELKPRLSRKFRGISYDFANDLHEIKEILPLVDFVNKTFKIGNDFSHYERKLNHLNSSNMEININIIVSYLSNQYQIIENKQKNILLKENFKKFNI